MRLIILKNLTKKKWSLRSDRLAIHARATQKSIATCRKKKPQHPNPHSLLVNEVEQQTSRVEKRLVCFVYNHNIYTNM